MKQAGLILPIIQHLLDTSQTELAELDAIAFGCGPGSFTGSASRAVSRKELPLPIRCQLYKSHPWLPLLRRPI